MTTIHVYEEKPSVRFTSDFDEVRQFGVDVERHALSSDGALFAENDSIVAFLQMMGTEGLPLTIVDGVTVLTHRYPTRNEMLRAVGLGGYGQEQSCSTARGIGGLQIRSVNGGGCGDASGGCGGSCDCGEGGCC